MSEGKLQRSAVKIQVRRESLGKRLWRDLYRNRWIYLIALVCLSWYFIFCYAPMGGIVVAFKDYRPARGLCRKAKTMGFLMRCALSSFSFLCTEEIFSISSNLIIQLFFLPSAVKVAFTSAVPFRLTYQSKVVSEVGVL